MNNNTIYIGNSPVKRLDENIQGETTRLNGQQYYKISNYHQMPPFLMSIVTFQVRPDANGGTILRIVHGLTDTRLAPKIPPAANSNASLMMLAA